MNRLGTIKIPADGLPILVERWTGVQATTIACPSCGASYDCKPDEVGMIDIWTPCPEGCSVSLGWAYMEADKCPGCGQLGWFGTEGTELKGACSRKCLLQAEYAASLETATRKAAS